MGYLHGKRIQECKRKKQWATSMTRGYENVRGKTMGYLHDKRIHEFKRKKQWATSMVREYKNVRGKNNGLPPW